MESIVRHQAKRGAKFPTGDGDVAGVTKIIFSNSAQVTENNP